MDKPNCIVQDSCYGMRLLEIEKPWFSKFREEEEEEEEEEDQWYMFISCRKIAKRVKLEKTWTHLCHIYSDKA